MATRHRLTPHFVIEEFDCHDGTPVAASRYDDVRRACVWWLEPMREQFGPIQVVSGYRTAAHNRQVGGASHSVHLLTTPLPVAGVPSSSQRRAAAGALAAATDVTARRGNPAQWAAWARAHRARQAHLGRVGRGGIGTYITQGFVHLDTGPRRDWTG